MIDFRCLKCSTHIRASVEVQNLSALMTYKLFKTKVRGDVRQLFGDTTTIQIKDIFCPSCEKELKPSEIKGMCQMTNAYFPLEDLRIMGIQLATMRGKSSRTKKVIANKDFDFDEWLVGKKGEILFSNPVKLEWKEL